MSSFGVTFRCYVSLIRFVVTFHACFGAMAKLNSSRCAASALDYNQARTRVRNLRSLCTLQHCMHITSSSEKLLRVVALTSATGKGATRKPLSRRVKVDENCSGLLLQHFLEVFVYGLSEQLAGARPAAADSGNPSCGGGPSRRRRRILAALCLGAPYLSAGEMNVKSKRGMVTSSCKGEGN